MGLLMTPSPKDKKPRSPRVNLTSWARLFQLGEQDPITASVVDISRAGLGLYAKVRLPLSAGLKIELKFFDTQKRVWIEEIRGRVVRCEKVGAVYFIGIRFSEVVAESRNPHLAAAISDLEGE